SKSKEIREAHGEKETERRKNKPDFDIDHQNQTCFLFESRLLSHSLFIVVKGAAEILRRLCCDSKSNRQRFCQLFLPILNT
ncbi:hypothetical protein, partial [Enterococcus larvae]|uniref:hypothetical protein n=1 Tax=Enterococcus larvae TaxID=2794352 RepID=UPI003F355C81